MEGFLIINVTATLVFFPIFIPYHARRTGVLSLGTVVFIMRISLFSFRDFMRHTILLFSVYTPMHYSSNEASDTLNRD